MTGSLTAFVERPALEAVFLAARFDVFFVVFFATFLVVAFFVVFLVVFLAAFFVVFLVVLAAGFEVDSSVWLSLFSGVSVITGSDLVGQ